LEKDKKMKINLFNNSKQFETFAPGEILFSKGQFGDKMYIVIAGEVSIMVGNAIVDVAERGDLIGEMSLIETSPRSATAIARTECRVVPINQHYFQFLVQQTPYFALQVMEVMAYRLRRMNQIMVA
jgi:CRP/FNR family cyclic AMP-dependent transcriptional regulator